MVSEEEAAIEPISLLVSPIIVDDNPVEAVAPHRRPFKKRLRHFSGIKEVVNHFVGDNDSDQTSGVDADEIVLKPTILDRQCASVYVMNPTHRLLLEKCSSTRSLRIVSPITAPTVLYDGNCNFDCPGENANETTFHDDFSERLEKVTSPFDRQRSETPLHPCIQAMECSAEDESNCIWNKQGHFEQCLPDKTSTKAGSNLNCVAPTFAVSNHAGNLPPDEPSGTLAIALDPAQAKSSRESLEQAFTRQNSDGGDLEGCSCNLSGTPRPTKGIRSSLRNRQSFSLDTEAREEEKAYEAFQLPQFLRTERGRKNATVQDVMDILVIPPRRPSTSYESKKKIDSNHIQDLKSVLKNPPPSSNPVFNSKAAPPKEFTTCSWPIESAPIPMNPIELPGMMNYCTIPRSSDSSLKHPYQHGTCALEDRSTQSCWDFTASNALSENQRLVAHEPSMTRARQLNNLDQFSPALSATWDDKCHSKSLVPIKSYCIPSLGLKPPTPSTRNESPWGLPGHRSTFIPIFDVDRNQTMQRDSLADPIKDAAPDKQIGDGSKRQSSPLRRLSSPGDQKAICKPKPMREIYSPLLPAVDKHLVPKHGRKRVSDYAYTKQAARCVPLDYFHTYEL